MKYQITQENLVKEFFIKNPNRDVTSKESKAWLEKEWLKRTKKKFEDPDRAVRTAYQKGFLQKIDTGIYRYDPDFETKKELEDFTPAQKKIILERDGYKCALCGKGVKEGAVLHVDHIKAKDDGGRAILENGQILCSQHNFLKKNLNQTTTGKKLFINLFNLAKSEQEMNENLVNFCTEILEVFEKYDINGHIEWKK